MSIKEKVQQIIRQAEAEKAAELRRQKEGQSQWLAECQEKTRQQDVLEKARFEKGKKALEATGVQRVFGEVFDILREEDIEVQLQIRKGYRHHLEKHNQDGKFVDTVAMVVEKERGEGETTTRLGVELEIDDPSKAWIISAFGVSEQEDILRINDKDLLPKLEKRLAWHIAQGLHRHFNPVPEDWGTSGGW